MPKVKFLQDFQGKETKEVFYKQGQEVELPDNLTSQLLKDQRVELVKEVVTAEEFVKPVVFENVTDVHKEVEIENAVTVIEPEQQAEEIMSTKTHAPRARKGRK